MSVFLARPEQPGEGIPLAVKDLFDTAGLTTTYGSVLFADRVPQRTAAAVARLEAAGYANVGKANLHEFAYGITSHNPHFGDVTNPRSRTPSTSRSCTTTSPARRASSSRPPSSASSSEPA